MVGLQVAWMALTRPNWAATNLRSDKSVYLLSRWFHLSITMFNQETKLQPTSENVINYYYRRKEHSDDSNKPLWSQHQRIVQFEQHPHSSQPWEKLILSSGPRVELFERNWLKPLRGEISLSEVLKNEHKIGWEGIVKVIQQQTETRFAWRPIKATDLISSPRGSLFPRFSRSTMLSVSVARRTSRDSGVRIVEK